MFGYSWNGEEMRKMLKSIRCTLRHNESENDCIFFGSIDCGYAILSWLHRHYNQVLIMIRNADAWRLSNHVSQIIRMTVLKMTNVTFAHFQNKQS